MSRLRPPRCAQGSPSHRRSEDGTALLSVLMVTMLLGTLSAALTVVVISNTMTGANHDAGQQALYAADAAFEQTVSELRAADWLAAPRAIASNRLADGRQAPRAPDGTVLDLARLLSQRQAESDSRFPPGPNRPAWCLFGHAPLGDLVPAAVVSQPAYVLVWIADDGDEVDGDPGSDSNQVLLVRAEAFGVSSAHRSIEAVVALQTVAGVVPAGLPGAPPTPPRREVRVLSWREMP